MSDASPKSISVFRKIPLTALVALGNLLGIIPGVFKVLDILMKFSGLNIGYLQSKRYGSSFVFDLSDYTHRKMLLNCFERAELKCVLNLVNEGDQVVDIGANVGFITIPVARRAGGGRVIAVEPIHRNFIELSAHVGLNDLKNVDVRNIAVGNQRNDLIMENITPSSDVSSGFWRRVDLSSATSVRVPCVPLAEIISKVSSVELLKVDAEGMEFEILSSAKELLNPNFIHNLMIELTFDKEGIDKNSSDSVKLLMDRGYSIYRVSLFGKLKSIDALKIRKTNNVLNVFACQ